MAKRPCIIMAMTVVTFAAISRHRTHDGYPELRDNGKPVAVEFAWLIGVILVFYSCYVWTMTKIKEHFPHLFSTDADRLPRHRFPYHPDTKRFGRLHLPPYPV